MGQLPKALIDECKQKLLESKMDLLNRVRNNEELIKQNGTEKGGDESDLAVRNLSENEAVAHQQRLRGLLHDIELALSRIENGTYGICEETEELIEEKRLRAIPWTRLSIEGAEIREAIGKKYVRHA